MRCLADPGCRLYHAMMYRYGGESCVCKIAWIGVEKHHCIFSTAHVGKPNPGIFTAVGKIIIVPKTSYGEPNLRA